MLHMFPDVIRRDPELVCLTNKLQEKDVGGGGIIIMLKCFMKYTNQIMWILFAS